MMNNNNKSNNELDKMVRARSVYVTSDSIPFDADASSAIYQLQEPVTAQEGFDLVYGVRAFGFNASAMNISRKQRNNVLTFETTMLSPQYVYNTSTTNFDLDYNQELVIVTYDVHFPDGLYTTDQLFFMLSNEQNYTVWSGYKTDVLSNEKFIYDNNGASRQLNNLFLKATFGRTDGGFSVAPEISSLAINNRYFNSTKTEQWSAFQVNYQLQQFAIVRNESSPGLYDLLFTNEFTDSKDHAPEVPQFESIIKGNNPPKKIIFQITNNLFQPDAAITSTTILPATVSPQTSMEYEVTYLGDDQIMDQLAQKYLANGFLYPNRPARFYHTPSINPLYIDVISDLPTLSLTSDGGQKGILLRQFALGGDNGSTSFFQQYDNPVFYRTSSSKENIDSIRLNFVAQGNKWSFFNLEFFMEILVFEYEQEGVQINPFQQGTQYMNSSVSGNQYHMPSEDEITSSMGPTHNSFPFRHLGNDQSVVYFQDPLQAKLKRLRK